MGRSRGGLTTKIHALVDACGLPTLLKITEGQAHDGRSASDMLGLLGRGDGLLADRGYDSDALRLQLAAQGAKANVKLMPNRVNLPSFNRQLYRKRTSSSASSTNSSISAPSPHDTTSATITISPPSNSPQLEFGCDLMNLRPSVAVDDAEFDELCLERILLREAAAAELDAIRKDFGEHKAIGDVELEHQGSAFGR